MAPRQIDLQCRNVLGFPAFVPRSAPKRVGLTILCGYGSLWCYLVSGRLSEIPTISPLSQAASGRLAVPITMPIGKRLANASNIAARLSSSSRGIIISTATIPNTTPQMIPSGIFDVDHSSSFLTVRVKPIGNATEVVTVLSIL